MAKVLGFTINIQGTETAIENATDLRLAIQEINKQLKDPALTKPQYDKLEKQLIDLKARQKEVNAQIRDQVKARQAELRVTEDSVGAYRQLSAQLIATRSRYKDLAAAGKENSEEAQTLLKNITSLDKRLKGIDASVGQFQRNVGDYTNAIKNAIPAIGQFSDGIDAIGQQTTRVGKAIATSFFIFELINQLAQGVQAISEFAEEFRQLQGQIQNTTQLTGDALAQTTAQVKAIADTYQEDAQQIAVAANTLSKEFGQSLGASLDLIEAGFRKGANAQGDFLDQLREYPTQFREAGFSLDQFIALSIQAANEGIYSDKGLDAVKEFGLRIREQTKATRGALENAFGEEFTNSLFTNINNGSISTVDALKQVSVGLRDVDLTAEQTQRVITDVFGGPGEDAGLRYLQLLADIDTETKNVRISTNEYQTQQEQLYESNLALADAQARVSEQLGNYGLEFEIQKNQLKAFLLNIAADFVGFFDQLPATISGASAALKQFGVNLRAGFGLFGETESVADAYKEAFLEGWDKIEKDNEIAELARKQAEKLALSTETGLRNKISELRQKRGGLIFGTDEFNEVDKEIKELEKRLQKFNPVIKTKRSTDQVKKIAEREAEKERQQIEREAERTEQARVRALEKEQADTRKQLATIAQIRNETVRTALGGAQQLVEATVTQTSDGFRLIGASLEERSQEILTRIQQASADFQAEKPILIDPEKAINTVQGVVDSVLPVIQAFQARAAERATAAIDNQITAQEESVKQLTEQVAAASGFQKQVLQDQLNAETAALEASNAKKEQLQLDLAKKEKRLNIITSIIQTALAVGRALANPPGPPFSIAQAVAAGIQGAAQTAIIAAQPLATGGLITGRRVTDQQNIPRQSNGDNVLATVRRGEVVLNGRQQAALGGAATFRAIGVPGFAAGGAISAPISAPTLPASVASGNAEIMQLIKELKANQEATNRRIDRIRTYVVSEDVSRDLAEGAAIKTQATLE